MKERNKIIPASYLILLQENKVLLGRRCNTGFEDGKYMLPSGHVELDENFTEAIIREAKEEIGIDLKFEDLEFVHVLNRKSSLNGENRVDVFFIAKKWSGEVKNMEENKCDDLTWFDMGNLPEETVDYVKIVISKIKERVFYSENNW